jgi:hypothetical protein
MVTSHEEGTQLGCKAFHCHLPPSRPGAAAGPGGRIPGVGRVGSAAPGRGAAAGCGARTLGHRRAAGGTCSLERPHSLAGTEAGCRRAHGAGECPGECWAASGSVYGRGAGGRHFRAARVLLDFHVARLSQLTCLGHVKRPASMAQGCEAFAGVAGALCAACFPGLGGRCAAPKCPALRPDPLRAGPPSCKCRCSGALLHLILVWHQYLMSL